MLQNKLLFNQSSVSLEIVGLPDYSKNENKDQISIISQWKLMILDRPPIEGNVDHLSSIMDAFYSYSNLLINDQIASYESNLIDIKENNFYTHNILLKSSKPDVQPLNITIGNSVLSDVVNCFEQLKSSNQVRKIKTKSMNYSSKNRYKNFLKKEKIINFVYPPLISLLSLFLVSSTFIYLHNYGDDKENKVLINSK